MKWKESIKKGILDKDTEKNGMLTETFLIIMLMKMTSKDCLVWAIGTWTEITIKRTDQLLASCKSNQQKDPQTQRPKKLKIQVTCCLVDETPLRKLTQKEQGITRVRCCLV